MGYAISLSRYRRVLDANKPDGLDPKEYQRQVSDYILSELKSTLLEKLEDDPRFIPDDLEDPTPDSEGDKEVEKGHKDYNEWRGSHIKLRKVDMDLPILVKSLVNELTVWRGLGTYQIGFNPSSYFQRTGLRCLLLVKSIDYGTRYLKARHFFDREFSKFQAKLSPKLLKFLKNELR